MGRNLLRLQWDEEECDLEFGSRYHPQIPFLSLLLPSRDHPFSLSVLRDQARTSAVCIPKSICWGLRIWLGQEGRMGPGPHQLWSGLLAASGCEVGLRCELGKPPHVGQWRGEAPTTHTRLSPVLYLSPPFSPQALSILMLPHNIPASLSLLTSMVDDMWHYAGDQSTDVSASTGHRAPGRAWVERFFNHKPLQGPAAHSHPGRGGWALREGPPSTRGSRPSSFRNQYSSHKPLGLPPDLQW